MRLTTYHPCSAERQEIRGLNLPGPPWAISTAGGGRDLYLYLFCYKNRENIRNAVIYRKVITECSMGQKVIKLSIALLYELQSVPNET